MWPIQFGQFSPLIFSKDTTFVIIVFAISVVILAGVLSYVYIRGRKRSASKGTIIAFNEHRKSHLILLMGDDSSPPAGPRCKSPYARNTLINSESKSFTSIKISPSRSIVFGHEMDAEVTVKVVLTPPTPAKKKHRESLIDYESEDLSTY